LPLRVGAATLILILSNTAGVARADVPKIATTVTVTASPDSAGWAQPVTLTATVTPIPDGGAVSFSPVGPPEAIVPIDGAGHASVTRPIGCCGPIVVDAIYLGTATYGASLGTTTVTITDDRVTPELHIRAAPTSVTRGDNVEYTVTMSPATADGSIRLQGDYPTTGWFPIDPSGTTVIDNPATIDGTFPTTACYTGSPTIKPACAAETIPIVVQSIPSTTTVEVEPRNIHPNDSVSVNVTVDPPPERATDATVVFGETAQSVPVTIDTTGHGTVAVSATVDLYGRFRIGTNHVYANFPETMRSDPSAGEADLEVGRDPVDLTVSVDAAVLRAGDPLVVRAIGDPVASDPRIWIELQFGGVNFVADEAVLSPAGTFSRSYDTTGFPVGTYRVLISTAQTDQTDTATSSAPFAVVEDTGPPLVSAPTSVPVGSVGATLTTLRTSWTATDPGSGIAAVEVQRSVDGGAYVSVPVTAPTNTLTETLADGHLYQYRVRATDGLGQVSAWVDGPSIRPDLVSDGASSIHYAGRWHTQSYPYYLGAKDHWSSAAGSTATITFTGRSFSWLSAIGPTRGRAAIYIDGQLVATVNLYGPTSRSNALVFARSWTSSTSHRVVIRVSGTGSHPRVDLDGFLILH
jgi:hypothetical protein